MGFIKNTILRVVMIGFVAGSLTGCGYNAIQAKDEEVKAAWAEMLNQYKSRSDLLPKLAEATTAYASHETEVFVNVTNARATAGGIKVDMNEVPDEETMKKFMAAQEQVSGAMSRLLAIAEAYPELKSDANYRQLSSQMEGRENRVNVARKRYIERVKEYNTFIRQFPYFLTAKLIGSKVKPSLQFDNVEQIQEMPDLKL